MRMLPFIFIVNFALALLLAPAPATAWTLVQSPTSATFNGVAIADEHLAIAVGNDGTIVHFVDGDSGTLMPSGTTGNLLDVYAVDADFAVAAGINVVLIWDGISWETLVENTSDTDVAYSPVWASTDRDLVLYGTLGQQFNFVCPHVLGAEEQGFCRSFGREMLTLCGEDGEITAVRRDGAIYRLHENLVELGDTFGPAHEPPATLNLNAAWIAPGACGLGPGVLPGIYAIAGGDEVLVFDGEAWVDTGLELPFGHELIWLGGTGGNFVLAVGFAPAAEGPGNEGVVWIYDGTNWTQSMDLPAGTPGLTDIAVRLEYSETVFASRFEAVAESAARSARPGLKVDILAAAEAGNVVFNNELFPPETMDLSLDKKLIAEESTDDGKTRLTFTLDVFNAGPADAPSVRISDAFSSSALEMSVESFTCNRTITKSDEPSAATLTLYSWVEVDGLPAQTSLNCVVVIMVDNAKSFFNRARVGSFGTDVDRANDFDEVSRQ